MRGKRSVWDARRAYIDSFFFNFVLFMDFKMFKNILKSLTARRDLAVTPRKQVHPLLK